MVIIKNKLTGIETECDNADVIKVCMSNQETYEVTEVKTKKTSTKK